MNKKDGIRKTLLGLGLDCDDGRKRITVGDNFRLYGGSKTTHETMKEKAVKFNEHLKRRGKTLDEISTDEVYDIADRIGLKTVRGEKEKSNGSTERD